MCGIFFFFLSRENARRKRSGSSLYCSSGLIFLPLLYARGTTAVRGKKENSRGKEEEREMRSRLSKTLIAAADRGGAEGRPREVRSHRMATT